jgi:PAS domain S-box-containing protein
MSDHPHRRPAVTPPLGLSVPVARWQDDVARARARASSLPQAANGAAGNAAFEELALSFEELSVADEELRAQNEALGRAQDLLAAEQARYEALFDQAPVAYLVTDPNGVVVEANRAACELLHCPPDHLVGKPLIVFTRDRSRRRLRTLLQDVEHAAGSTTLALSLVDRRQKRRRVAVTVATARDATDAVIELRWLLVDRTRAAHAARQRRQRAATLERLVGERTAELTQANAIKDRLVAMVSHELRTALSAVGGYAELLASGIRGPLNEPQAADVRRIQHAYEHLTHVVDDLLDYSRLVSGKLRLDIGDVVLADAVAGVAELLAPQARAAHVSFVTEICDPTVLVRGDTDRTRQILLNLAGNAIKFTPPGGRVCVRCRADDSVVYAEVVDDGGGAPVADRDAVFSPFVRSRTPTGAPGAGLGLAISRDLARSMGGDVLLETTDEAGSRFVLRLPRSMPLARAGGEG